jgi:hypothetical protein
MGTIKTLMFALVAVLAFSAVVVSSSFGGSVNNPRWDSCMEPETSGTGKFSNSACTTGVEKGGFEEFILSSGKKAEQTAEQGGIQKLIVKSFLGNFTLACSKLKDHAGAEFIGSNSPEPGTASGMLEYGECEEEAKPACEINGKTGTSKEAKITTTNLKSKLVFSTEGGAVKEDPAETKTLFEPETGTTFATIKTGKNCTVENAEATVTGKELAENIKPTEHLKIQETSLKEGEYWVNVSGKSEKQSVGPLSFVGGSATPTGIARYWLKLSLGEFHFSFWIIN